METLNLDDYYSKVYTEPCVEFEEVRSLCLAEDNWLRNNYLPENLNLEHYKGYAVVYLKATGEPVGMAGLHNGGRWPANVGQHLHREYLFPRFRRKTLLGLIEGIKMYKKYIFQPLEDLHEFDTYIITMQNRYKKHSKGYWDVCSRALTEALPGWHVGQGYINTCKYDVQKCWQNFVYTGRFTEWNPKLLTQDQWETLPQGD
jgi:hypothetical protein